jgi:uncharacterized protein (TIGR02444 family)
MTGDHPLWAFSVRVYQAGGLQRCLLRAQDECRADINFILLALFAGEERLELDPRKVLQVWDQSQTLREDGIYSVRELRFRWQAITELRQQRDELLSLELKLERQLQDLLYAAFFDPESERLVLPHIDHEMAQCPLSCLDLLPFTTSAQWPSHARAIELEFGRSAGKE